MKINFPKSVYLLRGNHESRSMTQHFTFRQEMIEKYDLDSYELVMECFDALPLAAQIDQKFICMHGGIGPELTEVKIINKIQRMGEVPLEGTYCDLLWSDPIQDESADQVKFLPNKERDCSWYFGKKATANFLDRNDLMSIVRAHQVQLEGYKMHRWDGKAAFPHVITIFSAPNYCDSYSNKASVLMLDQGNISIKQFDQVEHPYHLPDRIDIFSWSCPFLAEKVIQLLATILERGIDDMDDDIQLPGANPEVIRSKVMAISKMQKMLTTLREEAEQILMIKNMSPDGRIPRGLLMEGRSAIRDMVSDFNQAMELDSPNEKRPS